MAGRVHTKGLNHIRDTIFKGKAQQNLFLGLMTNATLPAVGDNLGSGITEISGTGYSRIQITNNTDWSALSDGVASMAQKQFTAGAGGWANVKGFFIATASTGGDVLFTDIFATADQGNLSAGVIVKINCTLTFT
jgi:hypothetical protein